MKTGYGRDDQMTVQRIYLRLYMQPAANQHAAFDSHGAKSQHYYGMRVGRYFMRSAASGSGNDKCLQSYGIGASLWLTA